MALTVPNPKDLIKILETLGHEKTHGVPGVKEFHSEKPGPRLILTVLTHGDEMPTLAAVLPLLNKEIELLSGSVVAAAINLEAAKRGQRKIEDFDLNRLPEDLFDPSRAHFYATKYPKSFARMIDLKKAGVFDGTHGVDVHTVTGSSEAIVLPLKGGDHFSDAIGIKNLIHNISHPQLNFSGEAAVCLGDFIGGITNQNVHVVELEGGGPGYEPHVMKGLMNGFLSILASLGMIDPKKHGLVQKTVLQDVYRTIAWDMAPKGYLVSDVRFTVPFSTVKKGEAILKDASGKNRAPIIAPQDSRLLFPVPDQEVLTEPYDWHYADIEVENRKIEAWIPSEA